MNGDSKAPMLDLFVFETNQLLEQLERLVLNSEKTGGLATAIHEVFRIMHTIKGSAAMMLFDDISSLAHAVEDVFDYLREAKPQQIEYSELADLVLNVVDFIKGEIAQIEKGEKPSGECSELIKEIRTFLSKLTGTEPAPKNSDHRTEIDPSQHQYYISARKTPTDRKKQYEAIVYFDEDCGMENIRAFTLAHELGELAEDIDFFPPDVLENSQTSEIIRQNGFRILFAADASLERLQAFFAKTMFLNKVQIDEVDAIAAKMDKRKTIDLDSPLPGDSVPEDNMAAGEHPAPEQHASKQNFISVNVSKMDMLMDLMGELVIAEAMVTQSPELQGLPLDKFYKSARQLRKITGELQDIVMSIRMVPLSATFHKMNRLVRDMSRKLNKQVELEIVGDQTEVDKNIIEQVADPLMHLIRNAVDHGIESPQERVAIGKPATGTIRLEGKNAGGEVWIIVQDDGKGLNKDKILKKAMERGLLPRDETLLTDKEVYSFILSPGFSTKDAVTEFSGRGVGMDVVAKNIEKIGGSFSIDSTENRGTTIAIRIPLTLAIIDGMIVRVGNSRYTIPMIAIKESFRLKKQNLIRDPDNNEMIMIRGQCYPVLRLHERFRVQAAVSELHEGILVMVETEGKSLCLFADSLLGQQQVVVKALPRYIKKMQGIAGCTLLGDGSVSLILDVNGLVQANGGRSSAHELAQATAST